MTIVSLRHWGNSLGIRIPTQDLKLAKAHAGDKFELTVNSMGGFALIPLEDPQAGWLEAFNAAAEQDEKRARPSF